MNHADYDILISGGGLVGAALVLALAPLKLKVGLVDPNPLCTTPVPALEGRSLVLSAATRNIFTALGVWDGCEAYATPITAIHTSDKGHYGKLRLSAEACGVPALGYVCPFAEVQANLNQHLEKATIASFRPGMITDVVLPERAGDSVTVTVTQNDIPQTLTTRLLVAADGARSFIRDKAHIGVIHKDYAQTACVFNITLSRPQPLIAYERFTDAGPLAVLPLTETTRAVIYTVPADRVEHTQALSDAALLKEAHALFGDWLGRWTHMTKRFMHPLHYVRAEAVTAPGVVLCGNASQSLHPIAGQGFNLGLRDVAVLAEEIAFAKTFDARFLARYTKRRYADQTQISNMTDRLVGQFARRGATASWLRNLGITVGAHIPSVRNHVSRMAMGFATDGGRLLTGLPLTGVTS